MATFFQNLWESIFTPGPTPTLLIATNVTFAALQLCLAALLVATWSVHFAILSGISGGLWWAINWFARELKIHQQQEEEKARRARDTPLGKAAATSDESETEVEGGPNEGADKVRGGTGMGTGGEEMGDKNTRASASNEVEVLQAKGELKQRTPAGERTASSQGTKSGVSTEDEWEKVSESEKEKDK